MLAIKSANRPNPSDKTSSNRACATQWPTLKEDRRFGTKTVVDLARTTHVGPCRLATNQASVVLWSDYEIKQNRLISDN